MPVLLTCPNGHRWQSMDSDTRSADTQVYCPVCNQPVSLNDFLETVTQTASFETAKVIKHERSGPIQTIDYGNQFPGFDILSELGRGGMGIVFRAFDRTRKETIALKTLKRLDSKAVYRFKQEFRILADIIHPNLVTLHELISNGREWFFTMELVNGCDFLTYIHSTIDRFNCIRESLKQLVSGISVLHRGKILHRDIKPSNVLVTREGQIVLLDFGLATYMEESGQHKSTEHNVVGTLAYMAPEQAGGLSVSAASDWYSVGVLIYQALTGKLPFEGSTLEVLLDKQRFEAPDPCELAQGIPEDLNALCVGLLRRNPGERLTEQQVLKLLNVPAKEQTLNAPQPPRERIQFRGRREQLRALGEAFRDTRTGRAVACHIHGKSGIGKTALMQHFLLGLTRSAQAVVLLGRCYEREAVPYKALDSLIDDLSRYLRGLSGEDIQALLPRDVRSLVRVFPVLAQVKAIADAPHPVLDIPDQHELKRRAIAAMRELLSRLADRRPVVLAIDDLQWGDEDSGTLLLELMRPPDPPALLLILSYRSEDSDASQCLKLLIGTDKHREWAYDQRSIAIESLSTEESRDLALSTLSRFDRPTGALANHVSREAGGNPFFIQEMIRHIQEQFVQAPSSSRELALHKPELSLDGMLRSRIMRLPESARRLLEVVAVAGRPLLRTAACQAAKLGSESWEIMALLRSERLLRSTGDLYSEKLESYHDRIRETVVSNLMSQALKNHHHRLAEALERIVETDPEELATHFEGAGEFEKAAIHFASAAKRAANALAFERASRLYRKTLNFLPTGRENRWHLQIQLADALANAGRGWEAANEYLAATVSAPADQILELQHRAATQYLLSGHTEKGLKAMKATCAAVGINLPETSRHAAFILLWNRSRLWLRGRRFQERDANVIPPKDLARLGICWSAALGLSNIHPIRGAALHAQYLLLAARTGEPYRLLLGLAMEIGLTSIAGGKASKRTARLMENAKTLARRISHPHGLALVEIAKSTTALYEGRWKIALQSAQEAEKLLREQCAGAIWELDTAHIAELYALSHMGRWSELDLRVSDLLKEAQERGDIYAMVHLGIVHRPVLQTWADDPEGAQQELKERIIQCDQKGFPFLKIDGLFGQIHIDLYCGSLDEAKQRLAELRSALSGSFLMRVQLLRIHFWEASAKVALAKAVVQSDRRHLLHAATACAAKIEREKVHWALPLAQNIRSGVALLRRDYQNGIRLIKKAIRGFDAADMQQNAAAARRRLGELIGGEEGRILIVQADSWMKRQMVKDSIRVTQYYQPVEGRVAAGN